MSRELQGTNGGVLAIWDVQTGVVINMVDTQAFGRINFHGDQRTVTLVTQDWDFYTYDTLSGAQLCQGKIPSFEGYGFSVHWAHKNTLQLATAFEINGEPVVTIYEFQPASTPPLCVVSSFPISPMPLEGQWRQTSFSPVTFHASFVTWDEIAILDAQNPKLLLRARSGGSHDLPLEQFSPDGCFFICKTHDGGLCIWHNKPTGYVLWSYLKPRSSFSWFSWSPHSTSILCWCSGDIQLLCLDNCAILPPDEVELHNTSGDSLEAHSTDGIQILTRQQDSGIVTVPYHPLGSQYQLANTDMQVLDIRIADNATFILRVLELADRHQEMGARTDQHWEMGFGRGSSGAGGTTIDRTLAVDTDMEHLMLPHDRPWITLTRWSEVFQYGIKTQKAIPEDMDGWVLPTWNYQKGLWSIRVDHDWYYITLVGPVRVHEGSSEMRELLLDDPCGYYVEYDSEWIKDSRGRKFLWLPLNWRHEYWYGVRWGSDFLIKLDPFNPSEPVLIEFQQ